jgi:hypothetical protein
MAFINKTPAPPQTRKGFIVNSFSGGLINDVTHSLMKDNQSPDMLNMAFKDDGIMEKRRGFIKYEEITHPNGNVTYLDTFHKLDGSDLLITQILEEAVKKVYVDGVFLCDVAGQIQGANYLGKYYFVDGDKLRVYDGTTVKTVVGTPGGYTPPEGDVRAKGEVKSDSTSIWYEPCAKELEDALLGLNMIPPKPTLCVVSKDRLVLSGSLDNKNYVYLSDVFNPVYFPASLPVQPAPTGDKITGLYFFMDSLVIAREEDIYVLYGNSLDGAGAEAFRLKKINTHTGMPNQFCASIAHNYLFYVGTDGKAYRMHTTQTNTDVLATAVLSRGVNFLSSPINMQLSNIKDVKTHFSVVDGNWYVNIYGKILVYNYTSMAWTIWTNNRSTMCKSHKNKLVFATSYGLLAYPRNAEEAEAFGVENYEYQDYDQLLDVPMPYKCYWHSRTLDMGTPTRYKQFRDIFVVAHTYNNYIADVNVNFQTDYTDVLGSMNVINMISRWGKAIFGDRFISRNIVRSEPFVIGQRGKVFAFIFGNGYEVSSTSNTLAELIARTDTRHDHVYYIISTNKFYIKRIGAFEEIAPETLFQPLKIYEVSGLYELRGYR